MSHELWMDCSHRAGSHSSHAHLPTKLRSRDTWSQEQHLHLFQEEFWPSLAAAWDSHTAGLCPVWAIPNKALWEAQVLLSKMFHTSKSPHQPCLTGTHDGTSWSFWDTAEIPSHASKQVTLSKPMSSRKKGHWHEQLPKFLFWVELIRALQCKAIKFSQWGNLESPTLDVAGRKRKTFCLGK